MHGLIHSDSVELLDAIQGGAVLKLELGLDELPVVRLLRVNRDLSRSETHTDGCKLKDIGSTGQELILDASIVLEREILLIEDAHNVASVAQISCQHSNQKSGGLFACKLPLRASINYSLFQDAYVSE